jgi:glucuronate isomerase
MFITEDFLLDTKWAKTLYHEVAAELPIIDYHAHLPPADIAGRKTFRNITALWLGTGNYGDH